MDTINFMLEFAGIISWIVEKVTRTSFTDTPSIGASKKMIARGWINDIRCILSANAGIVVNSKLQYIYQICYLDGGNSIHVNSAYGNSLSYNF